MAKRADSGQTTTEYIFLLLTASSIGLCLILVSPSLMHVLRDGIQGILCGTLSLACGEPEERCVVAADKYAADANITVFSVDVGGSGTYRLEELSDGRYRVAWSRDGTLGLKASTGGGWNVNYGKGITGNGARAKASAGLVFSEGTAVEVRSRDEALSFIRWHALTEVAPSALSSLPVVGPLFGLARIPGVRDPGRAYIEKRWNIDRYVGFGAKTTAGATAYGRASAARALIGTELGMRVGGDGTKTIYGSLDLSLLARAGFDLDSNSDNGGGGTKLLPDVDLDIGGGLGGHAAAELSLDRDGTPTELVLSGAAQTQGVASTLVELITGESIAWHNPTEGRLREWQIRLDLSDPTTRDTVDHFAKEAALLTIGAGDPRTAWAAAGAFLRTLRDRGEISQLTYETNDRRWGGSASGGEEVSFGIGGGVTSDNLQLVDASYWDHRAGSWRNWTSCLNNT